MAEGEIPWPAVGWEDRSWSWVGGARPPRADRLFKDYRSADPPFIARIDLWLSAAAANRISAAEVAIARLDALTTADLSAFSGLLLRSESVTSSKIERLDASYRDVAAALVGAVSPRSTAGRVAANVQAMQLAIDTVTPGSAFTLETFAGIHRVLMADDPYEAHYAGRFRDEQNWIGGSDHSPRDALFVPPRPEVVRPLLDDLAEFANRDDLPPVVQAAITHAQFETIHPFGDGNGRTGRVLVHAVLRRRGATTRTTVPVSTVLLADPDSYFDGLVAYQSGRLGAWLSKFAAATVRSAEGARTLAERFEEIRREWSSDLNARRGSAAETLLTVAGRQPVLTIDQIRQGRPDTNDTTLYRALATLTERGILTEVTGYGRNRVWEARDVLDLLDEFERSVGRRRPPGALAGA